MSFFLANATVAEPLPAGELLAAMTVPADAAFAADVRHLGEKVLLRAQVCRPAADDIVLVLSELFGNAVRHAPGGNVGVRLIREDSDREITVAVEDDSPLPPCAALSPDGNDDAESGRGLLLVEHLSRAWGWHRRGPGKCVWCSCACFAPVEDLAPQ